MTRRRKGPGGARKGAGRPPLGDAARSHIKTIKLTIAEVDAQERAAEEVGQTWTEWARAALQAAVDGPCGESPKQPAGSR